MNEFRDIPGTVVISRASENSSERDVSEEEFGRMVVARIDSSAELQEAVMALDMCRRRREASRA